MRGARKTGKSALLGRLQGKPFEPEYTPSPEIATAFIKWSYKSSDDKIRVEVWDVVDRTLAEESAVGRVSKPSSAPSPPTACARSS